MLAIAVLAAALVARVHAAPNATTTATPPPAAAPPAPSAPAPSAPAPSSPLPDNYTLFRGDGSATQGWPAVAAWGSFEDLWAANTPLIAQSCSNHSWGADNSEEENWQLRAAIESAAATTNIDRRFILATVLQESNGCVRAPTTENGVRNPGLMQSHNGDGDCSTKDPCPWKEIDQMIKDGSGGTKDGDGLLQTLSEARNKTGSVEERMFYAAARLYNSGSADFKKLGDPKGATACYVSDVANRLTGWVFSPSECRKPGVVP